MMTEEKQTYFNILAGDDFPEFIRPYIETPTLKRLDGIGLFCGVDYNQIPMFDMKYFYSRLDHSIACACITWHFTKNQTQTIAALLHDVGTPVFSHCVDFMLKDTVNQEAAERTTYQTIMSDNALLKLLAQNGIATSEVCYLGKYPVVENKSPKLCADRLEPIFIGGLIWLRTMSLDDIKTMYSSMKVLTNEVGEPEIGFTNEKSALLFFKLAMKQAFVLQSNEDKLSLNYVGDILKNLILKEHIEFCDLFTLTEADIIDLIQTQGGPKLKSQWHHFTQLHQINRHQEPIGDFYQINIEVKKRFVNPLLGDRTRVTEKVEAAKDLLEEYMAYNDTPYASVDVPKNIFAYQSPERKRMRQPSNLVTENS